MALIVSLDRGAIKLDLGDFQAVTLVDNEVQVVDDHCVTVAKHMHNRWIATDRGRGGDAFMTLNVAGPLLIAVDDNRQPKLGPYMSFSMMDGVLYTDGRVFGLWDTQNGDWYVKDAGRHAQRIHISFHATD